MRSRRRKVKRPMEQRLEVQRQRIARLLFLGLNAEAIARKLGRKAQAIRYACAQPEFKTFFDAFQREQFAAMDLRLKGMLDTTLRQLSKLVKHPDPQVRLDANEQVLRLHGKFVQRIDVSGTLAHTTQAGWWQTPLDDMTEEQRTLARQLMKALRPEPLRSSGFHRQGVESISVALGAGAWPRRKSTVAASAAVAFRAIVRFSLAPSPSARAMHASQRGRSSGRPECAAVSSGPCSAVAGAR